MSKKIITIKFIINHLYVQYFHFIVLKKDNISLLCINFQILHCKNKLKVDFAIYLPSIFCIMDFCKVCGK
jgi:hypothetical protein